MLWYVISVYADDNNYEVLGTGTDLDMKKIYESELRSHEGCVTSEIRN